MDKYITIINKFWAFYDSHKNKMSTSDIILYKVLLRYCNKLNWKNPFTVNPFIMSEICPLSRHTYYKALKNLNDLDLIKWKHGRHNVSYLEITINTISNNQVVTSVNFDTSTDTSIGTSTDTSIGTSTDTSIDTNIKTILDYLDSLDIKEKQDEFFSLFLKTENFNFFLKRNNLKIETDIENPEPEPEPEPESESDIENPESELSFDLEKKKFNFKESLLELGIDKKIVEDWLIVRRNRKATNTETAFNRIRNEIKKSKRDPTECIKIAVENDWRGFSADWVKNIPMAQKVDLFSNQNLEQKEIEIYNEKNLKW